MYIHVYIHYLCIYLCIDSYVCIYMDPSAGRVLTSPSPYINNESSYKSHFTHDTFHLHLLPPHQQ